MNRSVGAITVKQHPTFKRHNAVVTRLLTIPIVVVAVLAWIGPQRIRPIAQLLLIPSFICVAVGSVIWFVYSRFFIQCPACGERMRVKVSDDSFDTVKFLCPKCDELWDSGETLDQ